MALALLAPVGFALGGGMLFGQIGMAVGWLVGSWLFGPKQAKNKIFDPGAEEMPRFNTALRGVTIPILFGTNRVPSQIVWQHDYTVTRNETGGGGGGGKFGGSGMGKGTQQATGIEYNYKWDQLFHLGMVPERYVLSKAWSGSEQLNDEGVAAIAANQSGVLIYGEDDPDTKEDERTQLAFEEGFFYAGSGAGIANDGPDASWAELLSDQGLAIRWPHTCWIGIKQLDLGSYPSVPQLSWEVGPGIDATTEIEEGILVNIDNGGTALIDQDWWGTQGTFKGDDGEYYTAISQKGTGGDLCKIYKLDLEAKTSSIIASLSLADLKTAATTFGFDTTDSTFKYSRMGILGNTNYVGICVKSDDSGYPASTEWFMLLYNVDADGAFTLVGGAHTWGYHWQYGGGTFNGIGICGAQTLDDPIYISNNRNGAFGNRDPMLFIFPSINAMLGSSSSYDSVGGTKNRISLVSVFGSSFGDDGGNYGTQRDANPIFFTAPILNVATFETRLYVYIGKADILSGGNAWTASYAATYPNGFMAYINLGEVLFGLTSFTPGAGTETIANADFLDAGGNPVIPFDDILLLADGVTVTTTAHNDYKPSPYIAKLVSGAYVYIWSQLLQDNTIQSYAGSTYDSLCRFKIFTYNPIDGIFTRIGAEQGQPFDRVLDFGNTSAAKFYVRNIGVTYIEERHEIYYTGHTSMADASGADNVRNAFYGKSGKLTLAGADVTPPYIIYEILTNAWFGIGITAAQIDTASYTAAVAYCVAQDFYVSVQYRREESVLAVIDDLLSLYGGFLIISDGVIYFKQFEYLNGLAAPVRTIDNSHLVAAPGTPPVQITNGSRQDTFNKVRVNYLDRALDYVQNQVEDGDEVDQDLNGIRMREFPPIFVMKEAMARTVAVRALWSNLYARDTYEFKLGWKDQDIEPGDVITLVDSYHIGLQNGVEARIVSWKESDRGQFDVVAKQELQYVQEATEVALDITSSGNRPKVGAKPEIRFFTAYELPPEFSDGRLYVSWMPKQFAAGAFLWTSVDGISYANTQDERPYMLAGTLLGGLPNDRAMIENVEVVMFPRPDYATISSVYFNATLSDVDQAGRAIGQSLMWVGSEMMAYQGVNLVSQNRYRFDKVFRGWGQTPVGVHNSGDIWTKHGGGIFSQVITAAQIGTKIYYKVQPYNLAGKAWDISSIAGQDYTILGTHFVPQAPGTLRYAQDSIDHRGKTRFNVGSDVDIPIDWSDTAHATGFGTRGYGKFGYGDFTAESVSYRVEVVGSGDVVVRSTSIGSSYFNYQTNSQDNGAWRGNVAFKVTPYNQHGLSQTSVLSLELWQ